MSRGSPDLAGFDLSFNHRVLFNIKKKPDSSCT